MLNNNPNKKYEQTEEMKKSVDAINAHIREQEIEEALDSVHNYLLSGQLSTAKEILEKIQRKYLESFMTVKDSIITAYIESTSDKDRLLKDRSYRIKELLSEIEGYKGQIKAYQDVVERTLDKI